jgi:hypothetical protein
MKVKRPSPALAISIIALIVALSGTAVATTRLLITSSRQIKNGTISGVDLRTGTLTSKQLSHHLRSKIVDGGASAGGSDTTAVEAHRLSGPALTQGGKATVATLNLQPGVYAVFAKLNVTPNVTDQGLLDTLLKDNKTVQANCTLDVAGTGDFASGAIVSPGSQNNVTLAMQATRTLDAPGVVTLSCEADTVPWKAADTSIIAMRVGDSTRTEVTG